MKPLTDANGRTWSTRPVYEVATLWQQLHQPTLALSIWDEGGIDKQIAAIGLPVVLRAVEGLTLLDRYATYAGEARRTRDIQLTTLLGSSKWINAAVDALARHERGEKPALKGDQGAPPAAKPIYNNSAWDDVPEGRNNAGFGSQP